jgi:hypothetical protein
VLCTLDVPIEGYYRKCCALWMYLLKVITESVVQTQFYVYVLLLSLDRYLCWWTVSPRGYHPPSIQCFYHWIDTSAGGLLVPEGIIHPVVSVTITGSLPLLVDC